MMARAVTSSVKRLCDYESGCKLVEGIDITTIYTQFMISSFRVGLRGV